MQESYLQSSCRLQVENKNTRTTSYFAPFSSVFIVDFEEVNVSWVRPELQKVTNNFQTLFLQYVIALTSKKYFQILNISRLTKSITLSRVFDKFLNCTNGTKSCRTSQIKMKVIAITLNHYSSSAQFNHKYPSRHLPAVS